MKTKYIYRCTSYVEATDKANLYYISCNSANIISLYLIGTIAANVIQISLISCLDIQGYNAISGKGSSKKKDKYCEQYGVDAFKISQGYYEIKK